MVREVGKTTVHDQLQAHREERRAASGFHSSWMMIQKPASKRTHNSRTSPHVTMAETPSLVPTTRARAQYTHLSKASTISWSSRIPPGRSAICTILNLHGDSSGLLGGSAGYAGSMAWRCRGMAAGLAGADTVRGEQRFPTGVQDKKRRAVADPATLDGAQQERRQAQGNINHISCRCRWSSPQGLPLTVAMQRERPMAC